MFILDNNQRKYFGLEPILDSWDKVSFKGDAYRPDSILYFEGETIKKQIISTDSEYKEIHFDELTENRELILPKTKKGKPKKLTPSVLESKTPIGVYLKVTSNGDLIIGNYATQTTFYSRVWEYVRSESNIEKLIKEFINNSPSDHLSQIETFRQTKRQNIKYKSGDFFAFKINRTEYGFGRILFDVNKARKKKLLPENHGLNLLMGPPLLIKLYAFKSNNKLIDIEILKQQKSLPSDFIMDNVVFYGDFEIIGNLPLEIDEFEFPISYGMRIDRTPNVFLQWGLIHKELPKNKFNKYIMPENGGLGLHNPYGYYSIGFRPKFDTRDIIETIANNGDFDFSKGEDYKLKWDLRNPKNEKIRIEIFKEFELDPKKNYKENCKITGTKDIIELIKEMK
ncbi:MAG: immunity 26/phosphotriesterase HocA family protein [Candidatus Delongbacteria bacterium]|nr:immunity 26/phosphotriesterase HocA family protein [Candidatus Delongbacteria bacterium]